MFDVASLINTIFPNKELISKPHSNPSSSQPQFCQGEFATFCVMEGGGGWGGGGGGCYCGGHTLVNFSLHTTQSVQSLQISNNHPERQKYPGNGKENISTFPNLSTVNDRSCLTVLLVLFILLEDLYNIQMFWDFPNFQNIEEYDCWGKLYYRFKCWRSPLHHIHTDPHQGKHYNPVAHQQSVNDISGILRHSSIFNAQLGCQ